MYEVKLENVYFLLSINIVVRYHLEMWVVFVRMCEVKPVNVSNLC